MAHQTGMQLLIDESFAEKVISADNSVRLLDQIVEEMDLSALYRAYERHGRKPATTPSTMLKIVLYANMEGKFSSRGIKSSCERDKLIPQYPSWRWVLRDLFALRWPVGKSRASVRGMM